MFSGKRLSKYYINIVCICMVEKWINIIILNKFSLFVVLAFFSPVTISSSKSANHERKSTLTPTQRESIPSKSPVPGVDPAVSHSPFDPHHRSSTTGEVYRSHLPTHLDPAMPFHRALDPGKHSGQ